MPAFNPVLQPEALPGQVLRLEPEDQLRRVSSLEPIALIGPVDFGAITSGANATDSDGNDEVEVTELELNQNQVGQYRITPVSAVEIELRQTGRQEQRLVNANSVSQIAPTTPANLREVWQLSAGNPYLVVNNPNQYDLSHSLIRFEGFKYLLEEQPVTESDVRGQPISVPIDKLERAVQTGQAVQRPLQTRASRAGGGR